MNNQNIAQAFAILQESKKQWQDSTLENLEKNPFFILVGCILSLRTKDQITRQVSERLLKRIRSPQQLIAYSEDEIARLIYPVGFYRRKAKNLIDISKILIHKYQSQVPSTLEELLELPGVGRKTANLVLTVGFGKPGICVDTHVHRIVNRWGYIKTKTPEQTEMALRDILPQEFWIPINSLLVLFGQNICLPRRPHCENCPIEEYCDQVGIEKSEDKIH
ncbi:MAG TPA: endonuclease III [Atribacter sp.]|jgi:endonuclease-3|uniref:endonuclease III domain-containing protein n=1 Tax=Atribacter sp. TaxID=2847780 RepID=UPI001779A117|nr:endonuclease III [Atribacter sp.]MDD3714804.1 endonuclease III [Atribacterota bacterium]HHT10055.1 endonuclease III [Candidatus Atribacteria bacterium]HQK83110.1 endonuclease III [Atribacter sp.]